MEEKISPQEDAFLRRKKKGKGSLVTNTTPSSAEAF